MQPDFVIFLDENHCNNLHLLTALNAQGIRVERLLEHFAAGTRDRVWLPFIGQRGWILVTTDQKIRYRVLERNALQQNRVLMFCFRRNDMKGAVMADVLTKALPKMRKVAERQPPPFIAYISPSGDVTVGEAFGNPVVSLR